MKTHNYDMKRDLYELTTMSSSLEQYLTDSHMFYNPQGMYSTMPPMTLGTFLLRLRRIATLQPLLDVGERAQLAIAIQVHDKVLEEWLVHYQAKLQKEVEIRINSIKTYFNELSNTPHEKIQDYHPELYARTVIEELLNQIGDNIEVSQELLNEVKQTDQRWNEITRNSYFHWDERLRDVYPEEHYWWLYRELDLELITA